MVQDRGQGTSDRQHVHEKLGYNADFHIWRGAVYQRTVRDEAALVADGVVQVVECVLFEVYVG